jgi:KUP system potassium uptake protein
VMTTWRRGREIVSANRRRMEGSMVDFVIEARRHGKARVRGVAVFPHPSKDTAPLALRANTHHNHVLHETVIIVSMASANVPHVPPAERLTVDELGYVDDGIQHLSVRLGFADEPDLPAALRQAQAEDLLRPPPVDLEAASYFLSRGSIRRTNAPGMAPWRKALFVVLAKSAANPAAYFNLPPDSTVTMGSDVEV